jgi:hypothetical protein
MPETSDPWNVDIIPLGVEVLYQWLTDVLCLVPCRLLPKSVGMYEVEEVRAEKEKNVTGRANHLPIKFKNRLRKEGCTVILVLKNAGRICRQCYRPLLSSEMYSCGWSQHAISSSWRTASREERRSLLILPHTTPSVDCRRGTSDLRDGEGASSLPSFAFGNISFGQLWYAGCPCSDIELTLFALAQWGSTWSNILSASKYLIQLTYLNHVLFSISTCGIYSRRKF